MISAIKLKKNPDLVELRRLWESVNTNESSMYFCQSYPIYTKYTIQLLMQLLLIVIKKHLESNQEAGTSLSSFELRSNFYNVSVPIYFFSIYNH